jgi:hypothetical protein
MKNFKVGDQVTPNIAYVAHFTSTMKSLIGKTLSIAYIERGGTIHTVEGWLWANEWLNFKDPNLEKYKQNLLKE